MPTRSSKIINVADDFGISKLANRNILKLIRKGKVDRVSVLIDYDPANLSDQEIRELLASKVKLDLHLDYRVFLLKRKRKLKEGSTVRLLNFALGYLSGKGRTRMVEKAWEAQIKKFIEVFGKSPDGINSHQYIHLFPSYFKLASSLAKKYNIHYMRYGKDGIIKGKSVVYRILHNLRRLTLEEFRSNGCQSSNYLVSLDWIKNFHIFLKNSPKGTIEIVCHPERNDEFRTLMKYF